MNTPICDFVNYYVNQKCVRAHMPGHKGVGAIERFDLTEIPGAGVLYAETFPLCHSEEQSDEESQPNGAEILRFAQNDRNGADVISESEANAAALFGAEKTLYSTEGASLAIRAMLYLANLHALSTGKRPRILAGRNAHSSFLTAAALLDVELDWLLPEDGSVLRCAISPEGLRKRLEEAGEPPVAVYITSPDYLGNLADVEALSAVCHARGCLLLIDNAHGAYLRFLPENRHPIALGADLCCDSAHKTLPVLTGGAYLHLAKQLPPHLTDAAESAMQLFASTSPSYLILRSLDACNPLLAVDFPAQLAVFCESVAALRAHLEARGFRFLGEEPLKLTVDAKACGYAGQAFAELLRAQGIVCEYADPDFAVLMLAPPMGAEGLHKIESAFCAIPIRPPIPEAIPPLPQPQPVCSPRDALLAPSERLPVSLCEGRILAQPSVSCPPAVPLAICGERLTAAHLALFRYYNVDYLRVLRFS